MTNSNFKCLTQHSRGFTRCVHSTHICMCWCFVNWIGLPHCHCNHKDSVYIYIYISQKITQAGLHLLQVWDATSNIIATPHICVQLVWSFVSLGETQTRRVSYTYGTTTTYKRVLERHTVVGYGSWSYKRAVKLSWNRCLLSVVFEWFTWCTLTASSAT